LTCSLACSSAAFFAFNRHPCIGKEFTRLTRRFAMRRKLDAALHGYCHRGNLSRVCNRSRHRCGILILTTHDLHLHRGPAVSVLRTWQASSKCDYLLQSPRALHVGERPGKKEHPPTQRCSAIRTPFVQSTSNNNQTHARLHPPARYRFQSLCCLQNICNITRRLFHHLRLEIGTNCIYPGGYH
jgi:hypothetical protein